MIGQTFFNFSSLYSFFSNQIAQCSILFILTFSFLFSYCISIFSGILVALAFPLGVVAFNILWNNKVIESLLLFELSKGPAIKKLQSNQGCSVCGDNKCKREKTEKDNQPWLGLNVPKDVDQAIQDLFNKILNEFVTSWHGNFSKDDTFIVELRRCLRYASSILLKRLLQLDISDVILNQLVTMSLRYVNDYTHILQLSEKEKISIEAASVKYFGKRLHFAVYCRKSELQYLRCLSDLLSNYIVQKPQLKCLSFKVLIKEILAGWVLLPLTDVLSDPYYINSLILLALNREPLTEYPNNSEIQVQFLHKFVIHDKDFLSKKFVLQSSLSVILKDQKYLYQFMQFLKKEGVVHLLQFCLHVEEFSKKILNPELTQTEKETLFKEAWDLFSVYFNPDSPDSIHFPSHIVEKMKEILDSGPSNLSKLLNNPVLFMAYEVAYSILEDTYYPLFYLSDEYFLLLCGEKQNTKSPKGNYCSPVQPSSPVKGRSGKKNEKSETSVVSKLSSKFNKLLQFQAIEGRAYFSDTALALAEAECAEDLDLDALSENIPRNMSTWRVNVSSVTTKQDSNSKPYPVFSITISNIDNKEEKNSKAVWTVERRYNDFYLLQAKLEEFHGEFEDGTQLPPKTGMFSSRGSEFLESRRQIFEEYLQKLLQKPNLRGSDLLYFFLNSPVEFSSCLSVQDGIGRILRKSVEPIILRKEKGQHLDNFLNIFLQSTEGIKKLGKYEWQDINVEPPRKKRDITQTIFENNFKEFINKTDVKNNVQSEILILMGPWDCILYALSKLMGASRSVIQMAMTVKNLLGQSSDLVVKKLLSKKLDSLLVSARISHLIRLLQDAIFSSKNSSKKANQKILREKISVEVRRITNNFLIRWFLPNSSSGIETIIDSLQNPILNKHLCYCLLDEVVRITFPELVTSV